MAANCKKWKKMYANKQKMEHTPTPYDGRRGYGL